MILGVVLAGGASRRFGSDKALALYRGVPMLDRAVALLEPSVSEVAIVGGAREGYASVPDRPAPGLGPLGGLCGALLHAAERGFATVLTIPCDAPELSAETIAALVAGRTPAYLEALPVAGVWPTHDAEALAAHLSADGDRAMRAWARMCGARAITTAGRILNVNRPDDLLAADRA